MLLASPLLSFCLRLALYATLATPIIVAQNTTNVTTTTTKAPAAANPTAAALPTEPVSPLVNSSNDFAISLYKAVGELSPGENLFLSPVIISYGLSMLYAAAGGQTRSQLGAALRLAANTDQTALGKDFRQLVAGVNRNTTRYALQLAGCLFLGKESKIKDAFVRTINESFGLSVEKLNFEVDPEGARKQINQWVTSQTSGKMADIFDDGSITRETTMVLANTAYFNGFWKFAFNKNSTKTGQFSVTSSRTTSASMMKQEYQRELNYYDSTELAAQVLELPYDGLYGSMYIFLPHNVDGLATLETRLTPQVFATVIGSLNQESVLVTMPKFAMDRGTSMMPALEKLGVVDLFDPAKADLSGLEASKRRAMTDIVHKAVVSVDEDGKVTAAMPAMGATVNVNSVKFNAKHPFLFLVADKTSGSILFMGRVAKPEQPKKP